MMKKFFTVLFIIVIMLPMLVYLNPFVWGLRKPPSYKASKNTIELISKLNKKYDLNISIANNSDTLWYFIEVRNGNIHKLKNFQLIDFNSSTQIDKKALKFYADDFIDKFEHKKYFDSLVIIKDTLIYKAKIQ